MSFADILYALIIGPLETLFEVVYISSYRIIENPGICIIALSFVVNMLLLPLYRRTDAIQDAAIAKENQMKPYVDHIKKTFRGDERFMMLQTCYRQHQYKPWDAVKGLTPLVLEIPFFMAAYRYLSGLELLRGVSLGPIGNLALPDRLLVIGGTAVNLLPIVMTVINLISSAIYTRKAPWKTKLQLYLMAGLFLVLLYDSPSGLVFYWTLNNLFSLIKNIICKFVKLPAALSQREKKQTSAVTGENRMSFLCAGLVMTALTGLLIPSALIHSSPEEFLIMGTAMNPNREYIVNALFLSAGTFLLWMGLFYTLASPAWKKKMELGMWILCGIAIADYMFFGRDYGSMNGLLIFENGVHNSRRAMLGNMLVLAAVAAVIAVIFWKKRSLLPAAGAAVLIAMVGMSAVNIIGSQSVISGHLEDFRQADEERDAEVFTLSKTGNNVVVLMLDRAINSFVPYIFEEIPELEKQFEGFTYYPNTLSFGGHTNFGLPAVFGGYEYTPAEMDKRDDMLLVDKHNEALRVLPVLFSENGYQVSVCDPTYAGYQWIPDLSIYEDHPEISTHITKGRYQKNENDTSLLQRKVFFYSIFKTAPLFMQKRIYDEGNYMNSAGYLTRVFFHGQDPENGGQDPEKYAAEQVAENTLVATGWNTAFESPFRVLEKLPELTKITDENTNTFQMMCNETPHEPAILQMPDYEFVYHVDNTSYDTLEPQRTNGQGETLSMKTMRQVQHYHINAATYVQLGKWLDYLRKNDVYDNTRIILVSDHGSDLGLYPDLKFDFVDERSSQDHSEIMFFNPVLMVKDFNSKEFRTDTTFMTNADTPELALQGLIPEPRNPFTGNLITSAPKNQGPQYVSLSGYHSVSSNCGTTYYPDYWARVQGDMFDPASWTVIEGSEIPRG